MNALVVDEIIKADSHPLRPARPGPGPIKVISRGPDGCLDKHTFGSEWTVPQLFSWAKAEYRRVLRIRDHGRAIW